MYSTCNKQDFFLLHFCCITHSFCRMPSWDAGGTTFLPTVWPSILILFFRNIEQGYTKHSPQRQHPYHWNQRERCVGAHRKDSQPSQGFGFLDQVPLNLKPLRKTLFLSFQVDSNSMSQSLPDTKVKHIIQEAKILLKIERVSDWRLTQLIGKLSEAIHWQVV